MRNDCFALPAGVNWVPVDEAKKRLRDVLPTVIQVEVVSVRDAVGRVLCHDVEAKRSNPPAPNSAVDGYGFVFSALADAEHHSLPLVDGRAAAGVPFAGTVPDGSAIRILTGAILPAGVDTVVLEEDVHIADGRIQFEGLPKPNANTRNAGEDVLEGQVALEKGKLLGPQDVALLTALGVSEISVFRRLKVAVVSTGDELVEIGTAISGAHQIYDANRPMLLSMFERLGCETVDIGKLPDNPIAIENALNDAASKADVIFTSGGASAGDEDHVSRLLTEKGNLASWRIALKPGRPLALAVWKSAPVFGLPGNPVAAFVCSLVFGIPALAKMSGKKWQEPTGFQVPAAFQKSKKQGRREYLRARLNSQGQAEVFQSEGSGRISGLSWAEGIVELSDEAAQISPGTSVKFIPYSAFGL